MDDSTARKAGKSLWRRLKMMGMPLRCGCYAVRAESVRLPEWSGLKKHPHKQKKSKRHDQTALALCF